MKFTRRLLAFALAACAVVLPLNAAQAQSAGRGRVTGKLLSAESGEPIGYADVALVPVDPAQGTRVGTSTNADGSFVLEAAPGVYTLQGRAISYAPKSVAGILVIAGATKEVSLALASDAIPQEVVEVEAKAILNTEAALLSKQKKASSVGDAVSAEQVKRSPDRDAGDVLRRVTGTSLFEGKYVIVRGMSERYSSTEMDGVRIASPEQNKRVVPLDMIPSAFLENIIVQKTYTADRPGEFGGGDVQITTKDFPGRRMVNLTLGSGYDEATSFRGVMGYAGGAGDAFAAGAGSRAIPAELARLIGGQRLSNNVERAPYDTVAMIGQSFKNQWSPTSLHNAVPGNFLLSFGDQVELYGRTFGVVASVGASHNDGRVDGRERLYEGSADGLQYDYASRTYTRSALFSMLGGLSYRINPSSTITLKGTQARSADDETRSYFGLNTSQSSNFEVTRLRYLERVISSLALDGRHEFPQFHRAKLAWTASLTSATRAEPDRREVFYRQGVDENGAPTEPLYFYRAERDWGELRDDGKGLNAKLTLPVRLPVLAGREAHVDVGGSLQRKVRNSTYRRFDFGNNAFDIDPTAPAESLFKDSEWTSGGFPRAYVSENTQPEDSYRARQGTDAAFLSADLPATKALRAILGARVEHGTQRATTYNLFTNETVAQATLDDWDILPTANLVYTLDDRTNLRFAVARTLSRPDLRELTPGRTLNFFSGYQDIGNPDLQRASIWNFDLRFETYPGMNELFAIGGFYKSFAHPIEKQIVTGGSDRLLQPQNSDRGRNYGLEFDARAALARIDPRLEHFYATANGSLIASKITLEQQTTLTTSPEHPLQGQSNFLANVGLGYALPGRIDATVLVAAVGKRLYALGIQPVSQDIYEQPTTTLDAVVNWVPRPNWRLKLAGKNLTNQKEVQKQGDRVVETREGTRTFGLSLGWGM
jgi:outer membrane receptor protein involved in Fe transport